MKAKYLVTYLGGAFDLLDGGEKVELESYDLWGVKFPKGEAVLVGRADMAGKARALGCFAVADAPAEPEPSLVHAVELPLEPEPDPEPAED